MSVSSSSGVNYRFVQERESRWVRLSELLDRAQRLGLGQLSGPEVLELGRLYRRTASDLAYVRSHLPDEALVRRLNVLVGRAHGYVYTTERGGAKGILDFYWRVFPEVLYRNRSFVLLATAIFLLGSLLPLARPDLGGFVVPDSYSTPHMGGGESPMASSFITQNNIKVAFIAFAGGMTLGILTLYLLFTNGMMLGAVGLLIAHKGETAQFWPSIAPHGVLELTAIMIAGGAGLLMGWTFLHPGDLPRGRALAEAGGEAIRLIAGTIPMFIIAGTIEGFLSFTDLPPALKLTVSALSLAAMIYYFRRKSPLPPPSSEMAE